MRGGGETRVKERDKRNEKRMMYKGGRFAAWKTNDTHFTRQKRERKRERDDKMREKENDAREAYHGVIALSSINHVTYAPRSSMYSV